MAPPSLDTGMRVYFAVRRAFVDRPAARVSTETLTGRPVLRVDVEYGQARAVAEVDAAALWRSRDDGGRLAYAIARRVRAALDRALADG